MDDAMDTPPVRGDSNDVGTPAADPIGVAAGPAIARGVGAVLAIPPSPAIAAGAIAAAIDRTLGPDTGLVLIVSAEALLPAWGELVSLGGSLDSLVVAPTIGRAVRLVRRERGAVVVPPAVAAALLARSALPLEPVRILAVAWPELIADQEQLAALLHEVPKGATRMVLTSDPGGQAAFIERHAFKAPVVGPLAKPAEPLDRVRVATTPWSGRLAALAAYLDEHDPTDLVVWSATPHWAAEIRASARARGVEVTLAHGELVPEGHLLAFDPPPPVVLTALAAGRGLALMPPGSEDYFARLTRELQPVPLAGGSTEAEAVERERGQVRARIAAGGLRGSSLTLAPLFERYPAERVAAALHALWREAGAATPPPPRATPTAAAKIWVSAGRKDGASVGEWFAFLTESLGLPRDELGRIELRDTYTLIECAASDAERLAEQLAGQSFKNRRLSARIDRGRERPSSDRRPPRRRAP